jgi:ATP-binding cassette subfamily B (MDR/TAP) protein 1
MAVFAEKISMKLKIQYFSKCIEKDAAYYDEKNPTEMASRISKECSAIQRATGENLGKIIYSLSAFIFAFVFAFYWGYIFTLILLASVPVVMCVFAIFGLSIQSGIV